MSLIKSSLARKYVMALSGLFLVTFLILHVTINLASVFSPDFFNAAYPHCWCHRTLCNGFCFGNPEQKGQERGLC